MAAYAALVSLMNIMENIQIHPRVSTYFDKNQIESFGGKVEVLLDFVESDKSDGGISKEEVEDLESQIASAAHGAEDAIESYMVDRIHDGSAEESCSFLLDLQKIMADMDSIHEKVSLRAHQQPKSAMPAASPRPRTTENTTMVGFDGYLIQLLDWLTAGQQSDMHMISITGMGGIGKTTLARNLYEDSLIVHHFDVRAWVTISQDYNVNKVLLEILSCLGFSTNKDETEDELGLKLHKVLFGRRYVVVLDDMWSIEAWFKIFISLKMMVLVESS